MLNIPTNQDLQDNLIKLGNKLNPTDEEIEALESLRYVLLFTQKQFIVFFSIIAIILCSITLSELIVTMSATLKCTGIILLTFIFVCIWNYLYRLFCLLTVGLPFLKWYKIQKKK